MCTLNGITERLSSEREGFVDRFISQNCLPISALMKSDKLAFTDRGPTLLKGLMSLCLIIKRNLEERFSWHISLYQCEISFSKLPEASEIYDLDCVAGGINPQTAARCEILMTQ